ncbi:VapE domain-containing protein [Bradyrhizobium valentinum]|uniref:VapE domain-containing protein n=1 Tax=Bradyrhizobium valentinum TaxID=1518501 RepID=UPI0009EB50B2
MRKTAACEKRHSIKVGTTNNDKYLQSQTSNRRFRPQTVRKAIDINLLSKGRIQLLGEGKVRIRRPAAGRVEASCRLGVPAPAGHLLRAGSSLPGALGSTRNARELRRALRPAARRRASVWRLQWGN